MKKYSKSYCMLVIIIFLTGMANFSYADNADVLPKGVWNAQVDTTYYFPHDKEYDADGNSKDIASDYNLELDSTVFALLAPLDVLVPGLASVGTSEVSMKIHRSTVEALLAYGVTDRLTVGINIPYSFLKNKLDVYLNPATANIGKTINGNAVSMPLTALTDPFAFGDVTPITTEDIIDLLGEGIDVENDGIIDIEGYNYKEFKTFSDSGIGDIEAGIKYQYFKNDDWRLAYTLAARFPTGDIDDPDNLVDLKFGDGQYDILFRLHNDYTGIENVLLNFTFRYDWQLPDRELRRVPDSADFPLTTNKEYVKRDLGDTYELEISGTYKLLDILDVMLLYNYGSKEKDSISGSKGFTYSSLEENTDMTEHIIKTGLSFSTLPWFIEKKFPVPLEANLKYRNKFAGKNVYKSEFISLVLGIYF